ncbi:MAG: recombination mediator RecR [Patescibacteria group bacterium]|jgi:recombination protein RecR
MIPKSIKKLIEELSKLPGVGPKTAARLTFYLLSKHQMDIDSLSDAIANLKTNLVKCHVCHNISESDPCLICDDVKRDDEKICIVEEPLDVIAIEKTDYNGLYHIIGGLISPVDGITATDLNISTLIDRINDPKSVINEIILATDPSLEGEATAAFIYQKIKDKDIKITRIARGIPVGGDLEYADEITLNRAMVGRSDYS